MSRRYNWALIIGEMSGNIFMSEAMLADIFGVSQQAIS